MVEHKNEDKFENRSDEDIVNLLGDGNIEESYMFLGAMIKEAIRNDSDKAVRRLMNVFYSHYKGCFWGEIRLMVPNPEKVRSFMKTINRLVSRALESTDKKSTKEKSERTTTSSQKKKVTLQTSSSKKTEKVRKSKSQQKTKRSLSVKKKN